MSKHSNYTKNPDRIARLTPEQYRITQEHGTEPAFTGKYLDNHEPGIYVDIGNCSPLDGDWDYGVASQAYFDGV